MTKLQLLDKQTLLRKWYLARLRKRALQEAAGAFNCTPAGLIVADRDRLEDFITSRVSSRVHTDKFSVDQPSPLANKFAVSACCIVLYLIAGSAFSVLAVIDQFIAGAILVSVAVMATLLLFCGLGYDQRIKALRSSLAANVAKEQLPDTRHAEAYSCEQLLSHFLARAASLEERQNLIADYSNDVICTLEGSLQISCASPMSANAWGYSPVELLQRPIQDIVSNAAFVEEAFRKGKEDGGEFVVSAHLRKTNGEEMDTSWTVEWSNSEQLYFAVVQDVTAQREIERLKNEFVAVVSHDLQSPISNVRWTLRLIEDGLYGELNETGNERLRDARQTVDYLLDVIADLLDLHRIETAAPQMKYAEIELNDLIADSVKAVAGLAEAKHITLTQEISGLRCVVDPVRIKRVIINLVANAIKFSPKGSNIRAKVTQDLHNFRISISDQGDGIDPEFISRLFDRFYQVSNPEARREGSGLGLFASKAIVEAHGGKIEVQSERGKGTTMIVTLPNGPSPSVVSASADRTAAIELQ